MVPAGQVVIDELTASVRRIGGPSSIDPMEVLRFKRGWWDRFDEAEFTKHRGELSKLN